MKWNEFLPVKEPIVDTKGGVFAELSEEEKLARELLPHRTHDFRAVERGKYPDAEPEEAQALYVEVKETYKKHRIAEPSACVELEKKFRAKYGRHFPAENYQILGRELRQESTESLVQARKQLIADFDSFRRGERLAGLCRLARFPSEDEAAFAQAIFTFNLAVIFRGERQPDEGLATILGSLEELTNYLSSFYTNGRDRLRHKDKIMLVDRLIFRAGFLQMRGEVNQAESAMAEALSVDNEVFQELMERKSPELYPELY